MKAERRVQLQLAILAPILVVICFASTSFYLFHPLTYSSHPWSSDFSAFYNAGYNIIHDPSLVYSWTPTTPIANGPNFVYAPYFLYLIVPMTLLSFPFAQSVFSAVQFALLPVMVLLIYLILKPKDQRAYALTAFVTTVALIEPVNWWSGPLLPQIEHALPLVVLLPALPYLACEALLTKSRSTRLLCVAAVAMTGLWLAVASPGSSGVFGLNYIVTSWAYGQLWLLGQSKVLELVFILSGLWLAKAHPALATFLMVFSAADPRWTLLASPLFLYIIAKNKAWRGFAVGIGASLALLVLPFVVYQGMYQQYIEWIWHLYVVGVPGETPGLAVFAYEFIPLFTITLVEGVYLLQGIGKRLGLRARVPRWGPS
jgi:hypothetical protein